MGAMISEASQILGFLNQTCGNRATLIFDDELFPDVQPINKTHHLIQYTDVMRLHDPPIRYLNENEQLWLEALDFEILCNPGLNCRGTPVLSPVPCRDCSEGQYPNSTPAVLAFLPLPVNVIKFTHGQSLEVDVPSTTIFTFLSIKY
ncbi:hypothetical protein OUZ56_005741 [Daphnia magna]|uniref:Uncharacterized protein n=1 Tax=Daphnia magna TaxID=35525 RepID=A0ABQ9YTM0_9CRUS|nr:hypothetical protein OUZ56_005741 [Daphnia magna]